MATTIAKLKHDIRDPAKTVDMVPGLKTNSLISGPKFADAGYVTVLTPKELLIYDGIDLEMIVNKEAFIKGWRDASGLWRMPLEATKSKKKPQYTVLPKKFEEAVNNVYELPSTSEIVRYLHACAGFPTKATWIKAIIGGNYATWPHLSVEAVKKHYPESDETAQGHMKSVKEGIRSTKVKTPPTKVKLEGGEDLTIALKKHNDVYIKVRDAQETMYTDQTGAFPLRSRKGNRYIMILVEIDQNIIISEPTRSRTSGELTKAYQALMKKLKIKGITPKKHILDNECSQELKDAISENDADYELVPKGQHRRNIAERGIQTWKSHAIGVFSGFPTEAPLFLWDEMLPQIDMQVNLLRFSNVNPTVCSNTVLNGVHDFNRHPLAPLGIDMHMLEHPDKRKTWGVKGKKGTYIGTSL